MIPINHLLMNLIHLIGIKSNEYSLSTTRLLCASPCVPWHNSSDRKGYMRGKARAGFQKLVCLFVCTGLMLTSATLSARTEPSQVRYVKAIYSMPLSFDPIQMNDVTSLLFSEMIYDGLLRISNDYGYEGSLAESWTTSKDGRTLQFKLRGNSTFHNGDLITSTDVVSSISRAVSKDSKVYSLYDCIVGATAFHTGHAKSVTGLKTVDSKTVEIDLIKPFPPIMYVLAGATAKILPSRLLKNVHFFDSPIGSGPFRFVRKDFFGKNPTIVFKSVKNHPRFKGNIDEMILLAADEGKARSLALNGEVDDLANYPLTGIEDVFKTGQHLSSVTAQTWIIGLNTRIAPFGNTDQRIAFRSAFDTNDFRATFYPDAQEAFGYIPPGFPGYKSSAEKAMAAHPMKPSNLPVSVAVPDSLARSPEMAKYIEHQFASHGWNVKAKLMSWSNLMKGYQAKTLQAFLVSMNMDYPDSEFLLKNFESANPDNFSGINDTKINRLLKSARASSDRIEREGLYKLATNRVEDLSLSINLFHPRAHIWISKCVSGLVPNMLSDIYIDYASVRLSPGCGHSTVVAR
jgi:oligopeptide transport system substrate-binding protein